MGGRLFGGRGICAPLLLWHVHEPVHVIYLKLDAPVASAPQLPSSTAPIADVAVASAVAALGVNAAADLF